MPKIQFNKDGKTGSIYWGSDDWLAGMDTTSAEGDYGKMGGNPVMYKVDPLRTFGYVSPGYNPVSVTNNSVIDNVLRNGTLVGQNAYIISGGVYTGGSGTAKLHELTSLNTGTITNNGTFPHSIDHSHSSETGWDIANYYVGTTLKTFYSFSDATDWDVGTFTSASTFDDDFMSTIPATPLAAPYLTGGKQSVAHPLIVGDDDNLYIGDRNFLHMLDGQTGGNGTFNAAVLTLPMGWAITCFCKTQDLRLAIGAFYSPSTAATGSVTDVFNRGDARVFIWSYGELDIDYSIDLKDNYVSELIPWKNSIGAFTYGRKTLSDSGPYKLQVQNGTQFEVVKTWLRGQPIRGGVDIVGNDLYWNASGYVFSYTRRPDNGQYILNNIAQEGSSSGMLKFLTSSSIYHVSSGTTTQGLQYFASNYNSGTALLQAQVATPDWPLIMKGNLTGVTVKFLNTFTGGRSFRLNASDVDEGGITLINDITSVTSKRFLQITTRTDGSPLGTFSSIQPVLSWGTGSGATDAAMVEYIKFDFELVNATTS